MTRVLIIPAAGPGSRLGAAVPKPLAAVNGRPMLDHLAGLYAPFVDRLVVVAHPSFAAAIERWGSRLGNVTVTEQAVPTGMLDAILLAAGAVAASGATAVWITWADQIGVLPETLARLAVLADGSPSPALVLPTAVRPQPYIHFDRDASDRIVRLRQRREGDDMPAEGESDMGLFALARETYDIDLVEYARTVTPGSATGERNFLPFIPWLARRRAVVTFPCTHPSEAVGINTPAELDEVAAWLRSRSART